jgi:hypothetical protein
VIEREGGRWVFLPSSFFAGFMAGAFGAGSAFVVYLATLFFRRGYSSPSFWIGGIFLLVAGVPAGFGLRAWRTRRTALSVESDGRVRYGETELCAAGSVRAVRIALARRGEVGDCEVYFELVGGELVPIPSMYFGSFKSSEHARPFAAKLAEALGVQVAESS